MCVVSSLSNGLSLFKAHESRCGLVGAPHGVFARVGARMLGMDLAIGDFEPQGRNLPKLRWFGCAAPTPPPGLPPWGFGYHDAFHAVRGLQWPFRPVQETDNR